MMDVDHDLAGLINKHQENLYNLQQELQAKQNSARKRASPEEGDYERQIADVLAKRACLSSIVRRRIPTLPSVRPSVFVSTRFESDEHSDFPQWLDDVFGQVDRDRHSRGFGKCHWVSGNPNRINEEEVELTPSAEIPEAIRQRMMTAHFFLSVIPQEQGKETRWPVSPWLVEELGAAFLLPLPVIVAIEKGEGDERVDPEEVGLLIGTNLARIAYQKDDLASFAKKLAHQLETASESQKDRIDRVRAQTVQVT